MPTLMKLSYHQWCGLSGILPEGLFVWQETKSNEELDCFKLCYAVQNGTEFLGHATNQGDAIYFGLGSKRRIKDRVEKLGLQN